MEKINKIIALTTQIAKYAGIFIVVGQTFEFFKEKMHERFPQDNSSPVPYVTPEQVAQ